MLTFISVCAGIGGIDRGFESVGMQCVAQVEIDDYATKILEKHWPNVPRYRDIRRTGSGCLPHADVLAGGIPCQPHSLAGKRLGAADQRDLWPDFYRLVCNLRPRYAVVENVPGLRTSNDGRHFGRILSDLASAGYGVEWVSLRASQFGAPHRRERLFVVAYANSERRQTGEVYHTATYQAVASQSIAGISEWSSGRLFCSSNSRRVRLLPDPRSYRMDDGVSTELDAKRLRCLGNAVVPQCAAVVAAAILNHYKRTLCAQS